MSKIREIIEIAIIVRPQDGGMANFNVKTDGTTSGGHMSGGNPPFVHIDKGELDEDVRKEIFEAAEDLADSGILEDTEQQVDNSVVMVIYFDNETSGFTHWPFGSEPEEPMVLKLSKLMYEHKIGGW